MVSADLRQLSELTVWLPFDTAYWGVSVKAEDRKLSALP
jgi:hypothetical protein